MILSMVNFPFLDDGVSRRHSYGVYMYESQLIRFVRASPRVSDFNSQNKLTAKLLRRGSRYHKLRKAFSKFYRRHYELIGKYDVSLKLLLQQVFSNPEFYDMLKRIE